MDVRLSQYHDRMYGTAFDTGTMTDSEMIVIAEDPNSGSALMAWPLGVTAPVNKVEEVVSAAGSLADGDYQ